ncbi:hypothetical protein D3C75_676700 [compost metagenome]
MNIYVAQFLSPFARPAEVDAPRYQDYLELLAVRLVVPPDAWAAGAAIATHHRRENESDTLAPWAQSEYLMLSVVSLLAAFPRAVVQLALCFLAVHPGWWVVVNAGLFRVAQSASIRR